MRLLRFVPGDEFRSGAGPSRLSGACWLLLLVALVVTGCASGDSDTQEVTLEFDGVLVTAEVRNRAVPGDLVRLIPEVEIQRQQDDDVDVWVDHAVDGLADECELANAQEWTDLQGNIDGSVDRYPRYRVNSVEPLVKFGWDTPISEECSGTTFELVIVVGSIAPGGEYAVERVDVTID